MVALVAVVTSTGCTAPTSLAAEPGRPGAAGEAVGFALLIVAAVGLAALVRWLVTWDAADPTAAPEEPARRVAPEEPARPAAPVVSSATAPGADLQAPGGLRPGQLATCRDGRADGVAVTATLVDLAARGFLRIRAVPGARGRRDWLLVAVPRPAGDRLLPYEETLLDAVFADQSSALLGALHRRRLDAVRRELVTDAVAHGRLRRTPRKPLGRRPPGRTPAGDALVEELARFREELATAFPDGFADDDARAFGRWLPYAIVLDVAEDWVDRFRPAVGDRRDLRWYAVSRRIDGAGRDAADDACDGVLMFTTAMSDGAASGPSWSGGSGHSSGFGDSGGFGDSSGSGGFGGSSSSDWSSGGGGGGCGGSSGGGS